jgi:hypothetical protein
MKRLIPVKVGGCMTEKLVDDRSAEYAAYNPKHSAEIRARDEKWAKTWGPLVPAFAVSMIAAMIAINKIPAWVYDAVNHHFGVPMLVVGGLAGWAIAYRTRLPKRVWEGSVPRSGTFEERFPNNTAKSTLTIAERFRQPAGLPESLCLSLQEEAKRKTWSENFEKNHPDYASRPTFMRIPGKPCSCCKGAGVEPS